MSDYLLLKITVLEHASVSENCRIGEDILTVICDHPISPTPTQTPTVTPTLTVTTTNTVTPTSTLSPTPTITSTSITPTPTSTQTPTPSVTATVTSTISPTPTNTPSGSASINLNIANNWTYSLDNNVILKFTPLNSSFNNIVVKIPLLGVSLIPNNSLPSVSNIIYGVSSYGQLIYNGPIFENKPIQVISGLATYQGNILSQNTILS